MAMPVGRGEPKSNEIKHQQSHSSTAMKTVDHLRISRADCVAISGAFEKSGIASGSRGEADCHDGIDTVDFQELVEYFSEVEYVT